MQNSCLPLTNRRTDAEKVSKWEVLCRFWTTSLQSEAQVRCLFRGFPLAVVYAHITCGYPQLLWVACVATLICTAQDPLEQANNLIAAFEWLSEGMENLG